MLNSGKNYVQTLQPYLVNFPSDPKMVEEKIDSFVSSNMFDFVSKDQGIAFAYNTIMLITDAKKKIMLEEFIEINNKIGVSTNFIIDVYMEIRG